MTSQKLVVDRDLVLRPAACFDVTSDYPEAVWLPVVGPSTFLLWRHLARRLARTEDLVVIDIETLARSLGLSSQRGDQSAFARSMRRAERFDLLRRPRLDLALVQLLLPPVPDHALTRQHPDVITAHQRHLHASCTATVPASR